MLTFNELEQDLNIIATYELIDRFDFKPLSLHGVTHVANVVKIVEEILTMLNEPPEIVELGKIAAYLHDLGMKEGKKNHAKRSVKEAKILLKGKKLSRKQKKCVLKAIKYHSESGKQKDIVGATLIFADKLDADKTRLGEMGYEVDGLKQTQFIDKVNFFLEDKTLSVIFNATNDFDVEEFLGYYHSAKIFRAVETFADFIGYDYCIYLNDVPWVDKNGIKKIK